ncbi:CLI_3235 family bacteriocin precursor [Clostridium sporogenes]|uniref:CLI_3235 family bacteriocin precursor n=1 Tax=Clostridium sporogenes TaxID=1509 RepID=UPI002238EA8F|nr:CLI_3235 family bacteriocin precursor [Clostridium sporogenes]MCW6060206.1 CLI_3235 family bacteriocin precursor [Clostridium sporogenes]MCW6068150.1 CLI_3235 family bacteriocin precursor [Clostridium sporogenes]
MKKLGKKLYQMVETVEAYGCDCGGSSCAYPDCSTNCPYGNADAYNNQRIYKHMDANNDTYNHTSNQSHAY